MERYNLPEPPRQGLQRVWTDGSQQEGEDGKPYAGYGAWFGDGHTLDFGAPLEGSVQTNSQAELTADIEALRLVLKTADTRLCVHSQLMTEGATLWLEGEGGKQKPIKNVDLWQQLYDILQTEEWSRNG